jgi:hypothetical protein
MASSAHRCETRDRERVCFYRVEKKEQLVAGVFNIRSQLSGGMLDNFHYLVWDLQVDLKPGDNGSSLTGATQS